MLVTTTRALKLHGGKDKDRLQEKDLPALRRGMENLDKHIENVGKFNKRAVVSLNRFEGDSCAELALIEARCRELETPFALSEHYFKGGDGALDLAKEVMQVAARSQPYKPLYQLDQAVEEKIRIVCREMYGATTLPYQAG